MRGPGAFELAQQALLRRNIQAATRRGAVGLVIELVRSRPYGLEVLAAGFGGALNASSRASFAEYCLRVRQPQVLIGLVEGTPGYSREQILHAATAWSHFNRVHRTVISRTRSLFAHACESRSLDALQLAVRLQPDFAGLTFPVRDLGGFYPLTVHARMLHSFLFEREQAVVDGALACCRYLLERRAPVATEQSASPVAEWFVCARDAFDRGEELVPLLRAYAAAGYLDPSTRFGPNATRLGACLALPLLAAIEQGNRPVAAELIAAGCDLDAVDAELRAHGHADLAAKIRFVTSEGAEEFVAEITEALMRRRIAAHAAHGAPPAYATATPCVRRARL